MLLNDRRLLFEPALGGVRAFGPDPFGEPLARFVVREQRTHPAQQCAQFLLIHG